MVKFFENIFHIYQFFAAFREKFPYPESRLDGNDFPPLPPPLVTTRLGSYEGYFMKVISGRDIYAFEGIRYAEPPERFKAPREKLPFSGTFSAKGSGQRSCQTNSATVVVAQENVLLGDGNCLSCNIYTPKILTNSKDNAQGYPVILHFHGGGFESGSSYEYGPAYLLEKNLVLVNCNYRLGAEGFLSTGDSAASGNWGLKDAALALNFVHSHIKAFGGNPDRIILFGQSAGGALVHLLLLAPAISGKVAGAMCFSGNAFSPFAVHDANMAAKLTRRLAVLSWCPTHQGSPAMVDCLRRRNPKNLATLQNILHVTEADFHLFRPVVEPNVSGALLTLGAKQSYQMGRVPKIPIIFSGTSSDIDLFHISFRALRLNLPSITTLAAAGFLSNILFLKGEPQENRRNVEKILKFYGGIDYLSKNPDKFFTMLNDGLFRIPMWKCLQTHAKIAPTFGMEFGWKSMRGFAGRFSLNPSEFGTPHAEELFYIFNRTDVEPVPRSHPDMNVVQLFQTILENFGKFGKLQFVEDLKSGKLTSLNPVDTRKNTFDMAVIGQRGPNFVEMMLENNLTKFWGGLNYL